MSSKIFPTSSVNASCGGHSQTSTEQVFHVRLPHLGNSFYFIFIFYANVHKKHNNAFTPIA